MYQGALCALCCHTVSCALFADWGPPQGKPALAAAASRAVPLLARGSGCGGCKRKVFSSPFLQINPIAFPAQKVELMMSVIQNMPEWKLLTEDQK